MGDPAIVQAHHLVSRLMHMSQTELGRTVFLWSGGSMTFGQLRDRMLRLAGWLSDCAGVRPGDRVALCLPKSPEAVLLMYAILAAGAVFAPLQFRGPPERLNAILTSMRPRLLLTSANTAVLLAPGNPVPRHEIELRDDGGGLAPLLEQASPRENLAPVAPDDLGWLIFTSGSTGEPKGVMLSHRNMTANVEAMQQRDAMSPSDLRISHAPMHYIAAFDLLFPLVSGVRVFLLPQREAMFPERVTEVMEAQRSTIWSSSATALRLLLERGQIDRRDLSALCRISFFGEPMTMSALRQVMAALPRVEFVNHYGATEIDNIANYIVPRPLPEGLLRLPLGLPVDYCNVTLRDESGREVGEGEVGEICVVSAGVTSGYWNDPALTASRRLAGQADSLRTGDFAYRDAGGLLHSIGRRDQMVKIRGQRLDLGEVEAILRQHPQVRDAFAVACGAPDMEIRAVVLSEESSTLLAELNLLCRQRLPGYGRPARIATLAQFPLLATGKIDRPALRKIAEG
jgi:L-proline---[L-prolyl-carrier protein] ligase